MLNIFIGFVISFLLIGFIGFIAIMFVAYRNNKPIKQVADQFIGIVSEERAEPRDYVSTFEFSQSGRKVLEQLIKVFESDGIYTRGGQDAERETCYKLGQKSVVDFINLQLAKAKVKQLEEKEDEVD